MCTVLCIRIEDGGANGDLDDLENFKNLKAALSGIKEPLDTDGDACSSDEDVSMIRRLIQHNIGVREWAQECNESYTNTDWAEVKGEADEAVEKLLELSGGMMKTGRWDLDLPLGVGIEDVITKGKATCFK